MTAPVIRHQQPPNFLPFGSPNASSSSVFLLFISSRNTFLVWVGFESNQLNPISRPDLPDTRTAPLQRIPSLEAEPLPSQSREPWISARLQCLHVPNFSHLLPLPLPFSSSPFFRQILRDKRSSNKDTLPHPKRPHCNPRIPQNPLNPDLPPLFPSRVSRALLTFKWTTTTTISPHHRPIATGNPSETIPPSHPA